nr:shikimate dehydrogenase [Saliniradius amylolyticus]
MIMDKYAVIGNPIAHSMSPLIHRQFAEQTGQELSYEKILSPLEHFSETVQDFIRSGGMGCNVTLPFKEQAFQLATRHSEDAELAGAVNTLSCEEEGIFGDNTDGEGLINDLKYHQVPLTKARVLLIGAGGAARGVLLPLLRAGVDALHIANRTPSKAQDLEKLVFKKGNVSASGLDNKWSQPFDIIINASSSGLSGERPDISSEIIGQETYVYDMVYGQQQTPFNQWAEQQGAVKVIDGLGMLVEQAALSFSIWRGVMPDTQSVRQALRNNLSA